MLKLFTHDTTDLHPTLNRLVDMDPTDYTAWHQRYILLLWLSLICMLPFDLASDDSPPTTSLFVNSRNTDGGTLDTP